ncbi:MAG: DUF262 domain-containing protein [Candidatus Scalindua rubra]|uniref:GmrSD restriction endonucleases N-terminal domain-containing protein n=1 Tax=Candidatus Scalindua brodae TaxID=237368 RepID=A0A0B0ENH6_9BACT|nr:MAG: hypothetical protein SCABRO_02080 [Candidatus Scalindua brodae]MBZ0107298.1 DUF262 domain-containing protein [Candidatus Scalindua rubra]TWU32077.1 hypothetical protein S225a_18410 [Candidatus Brocadiaceae bacterium S225]
MNELNEGQIAEWIDVEVDVGTEEDVSFTEYDISASPNDFNIKTLFDFIDSGIVKIPGFQRNYVWDIKRASKLIESLIIGIPVPQIFLFEEAKNKFIVIDGQQRYMTIYFFKKKRFPRKEKRLELREIFDVEKGIPEEILNNNEYFTDFNLQLPTAQSNQVNKFNKLNYYTLDENDQTSLDLRTIRNIIIKQNSPDDGHSIVFEIFNRLNSGGINLKPQEIRTSLFHSSFYDMLYKINLYGSWRSLTPTTIPNLHMKDVEILLRGFAMLMDGSEYKPSMTKFLNKFSYEAKSFPPENITYLENLFKTFVDSLPQGDEKLFHSKTGRFNISVYESIFVAACKDAFQSKNLETKSISTDQVERLKNDQGFIEATQSDTASEKNVKYRIDKAIEVLN